MRNRCFNSYATALRYLYVFIRDVESRLRLPAAVAYLRAQYLFDFFCRTAASNSVRPEGLYDVSSVGRTALTLTPCATTDIAQLSPRRQSKAQVGWQRRWGQTTERDINGNTRESASCFPRRH